MAQKPSLRVEITDTVYRQIGKDQVIIGVPLQWLLYTLDIMEKLKERIALLETQTKQPEEPSQP